MKVGRIDGSFFLVPFVPRLPLGEPGHSHLDPMSPAPRATELATIKLNVGTLHVTHGTIQSWSHGL